MRHQARPWQWGRAMPAPAAFESLLLRSHPHFTQPTQPTQPELTSHLQRLDQALGHHELLAGPTAGALALWVHWGNACMHKAIGAVQQHGSVLQGGRQAHRSRVQLGWGQGEVSPHTCTSTRATEPANPAQPANHPRHGSHARQRTEASTTQ